LIGRSPNRFISTKYFFLQDTLWPIESVQCEAIKRVYLREHPQLARKLDKLFDQVSTHTTVDDVATDTLLTGAEQRLLDEGDFDPASIADGRERVIASIVRRQGQPAFRKRLLAAYGGRCAITGCTVEAILEAAHIAPYKGSETNRACNGLLLRADWHTLFDLLLVGVHAPTMTLLISPRLAGSEYEKYRGKKIQLPKDPACHPSRKALEHHRKRSRLRP
jgi:predicted restriction endonuclease